MFERQSADAAIGRAFVEALAVSNRGRALAFMHSSVSCSLLNERSSLRLPSADALTMIDFRHTELLQPVDWGATAEGDSVIGFIEFLEDGDHRKRWNIRMRIRDSKIATVEGRWSASVKSGRINSAA